MANDCLVSKLKKVADNPELVGIGEIVLKNFTGGSYYAVRGRTGYVTIKVLKGHMYSDAALTESITEKVNNESYGYGTVYLNVDENPVIKVTNKYDHIYQIALAHAAGVARNAKPEIDFSDLCYIFNVTIFNIDVIKTSGRMEDLVETVYKNSPRTNGFTLNASSNTPSNVTLNGIKIVSDQYYRYEDGIINVYTSNPSSGVYEGLIASYNISTEIWTYSNS